jgi:hypothetical protein
VGKRIVLLEMDTEDAEEFVRIVNTSGKVLADHLFTEAEDDEDEELGFAHPSRTFNAIVQAVVAKPIVWCKCDVPVETKYQRRKRMARREQSWHRGANLGWWCCVNCNKPSKAVMTHFVTSMLAGCNDLLPKILDESATPLSPSERWRLATGTANPHMDAKPQMPFADTEPKKRRKPRRSELDREARAAGA